MYINGMINCIIRAMMSETSLLADDAVDDKRPSRDGRLSSAPLEPSTPRAVIPAVLGCIQPNTAGMTVLGLRVLGGRRREGSLAWHV